MSPNIIVIRFFDSLSIVFTKKGSKFFLFWYCWYYITNLITSYLQLLLCLVIRFVYTHPFAKDNAW